MNPWLHIPLADYEAHMALPQVAQAPMLAAQLARFAEETRPHSLAVAGVAGGNGLESLSPEITRRVVAIDVNRDYLAAVLQLPSPDLPEVSETPYTSLKALAATFHPVSPLELVTLLVAQGFALVKGEETRLPSGKTFHLGHWQRK